MLRKRKTMTNNFNVKFKNIIDLRDTMSSAIAWWKDSGNQSSLASRKSHTHRELVKLLEWAENPVAIQQLKELITELEENQALDTH
jgi:hypothetical protein